MWLTAKLTSDGVITWPNIHTKRLAHLRLLMLHKIIRSEILQTNTCYAYNYSEFGLSGLERLESLLERRSCL